MHALNLEGSVAVSTPQPPESTRFLSGVLNAVDTLLIVLDRDLHIVDSNWRGIAEIPPAERHNAPHCFRRLLGLDPLCESCGAERAISQGRRIELEEHDEDSNRYFEVSFTPILNGEFILQSVRDVTEQRTAEVSRQRTAAMLETSEQLADVGSWEFEVAADRWSFSPQCKVILGAEIDSLRTDELASIAHPDDHETFWSELESAQRDFKRHRVELRILRPGTHEVRYLQVNGIAVGRSEDGAPLRVIGSVLDVTDQRRTTEKLRRLVAEKERLMTELNHRVKNNLALVTALLKIKDQVIGDAADLSGIVSQVRTIGFVHEKLLDTDDVRRIEFLPYARSLLDAALSLYAGQKVEVTVTGERCSIETKTAVSLGLIVNELATNAMKHGFRSRARPWFRLEFACRDSQLELIVSSSGPALGTEIDLDNPEGAGLQLVRSLVEQIRGTISFTRTEDPTVTITLPIPDDPVDPPMLP